MPKESEKDRLSVISVVNVCVFMYVHELFNFLWITKKNEACNFKAVDYYVKKDNIPT